MSTRLRFAFQVLACGAALLVPVWTCTAQTPAPTPTPTPTPTSTTAAAGGAPPAQGPASAPASTPDGDAQGKPEQKPQSETPPDGFKMGAYTFKPGGRVKLDVIRDFKPIGSEDSFDPRTIPLDDREGTFSNVHAKETRLNLDIRGMADNRELRMFIETDFYGSSSVLRLRHAYGSYGGLLAGQTWSTFMDEDNMPRTIDFESPTSFASIRQAQVRWTQKIGQSVTWSAALEDNKSTIVLPDIPGKAEYPMPDVVTRFRFNVPRGHVSTSAFLGQARFRPDEGDTDTVTLWGSMVSVKLTTFGNDYGYAVFTYGEGIGRYRGATTAVPDETGKLHAAGGAAIMGGYEHFWSERWSTNATFSFSDTIDKPFYTEEINKSITYGAVNLLYWFLGDRAWTGVEYLFGQRDAFGAEGLNGAAHRIQYAVRFNLP